MTLVAGVDSSTQSCKVVVRDVDTGKTVRSGKAPHPEGTEVDPVAWEQALERAVAAAGGLEDVVALGIGGQQHGMVCLDSEGNVVRPALLWNDTRSANDAQALVDELGAKRWADEVGSVPVASLTVTKLRWLARNEPDNFARTTAVCLPHDWLTWRLTGKPMESLTTDRGDASGTGYWSASKDAYCLDLLDAAAGRSDFVLPRIAGPSEVVGETVAVAGVPAGISLSAGTGDNMAAALGLMAKPTDVIISVGTSGVVSVVSDVGTHDASGLVTGFCDATGNFLPLACTLNAGQVLDATRGLLGIDFASFDQLATNGSSNGLTLLPYLSGERTPNRPNARGVLSGIDLANFNPASLARAAVESIALSLADGVGAIRDCGVQSGRVMLVGGGASSSALQRCLASFTEQDVHVPTPGEYVADGGAAQAAWAHTGKRPIWDLESSVVTPQSIDSAIAAAYASLRNATAPDAWPS